MEIQEAASIHKKNIKKKGRVRERTGERKINKVENTRVLSTCKSEQGHKDSHDLW